MQTEAKKYQAFYTNSTPIVEYMVNKLQVKHGDKIFDPCGGDGVFVEALLKANEYADIDVCELNVVAVNTLKNKFSAHQNVKIRACDTLLDSELMFNSCFGGIYDKIIANPPYGAWQDADKRVTLKKIYSDLYVKETYALFLFRCIELLKDEGVLTFIIPDTFLNLHMHKAIRKHILSRTKVLELALFPSSFFPGVNFGYANLSIITLQKTSCHEACFNNSFNVLTNFKNVKQLVDSKGADIKIHSLSQQEVFLNPDHAFLISDNSLILKSICSIETKIGDIASCVTGFYSGDDKTFLQVINPSLKNGKNYNVVDSSKINRDYKNIPFILDGIDGEKSFLPIVKGGNAKYWKPENWFMNWGKEAVSHYKNNKKTRFQNQRYYFKFGIGVPMISSSSISASLIENKLFDQSIVGIFPEDEAMTYYLLAFFNSPTCNKLIRTINPSANNPANYLKKIPFIAPTEGQKNLINDTTKNIIKSIMTKGSFDHNMEAEINKTFEFIYGF